MKRLRDSWLIPYFALEEEGKPLYDRMDFSFGEGSIEYGKIDDITSRLIFKFDAFIDATMRLYNVGLAKPYTPLFIAVVSVAVLRRVDKKLINTPFSKSLYLLLFPFQTYREFIQKGKIQVSYIDVENFLKKVKNWFNSRGLQCFYEYELNHKNKGGREIFKHNNCLIICDTSKRGVAQKGREYLISENDLYNPYRVKEAARARVRRIMNLLEFAGLIEYTEKYPNSYVLKDGLIDKFSRVCLVFGINKEFYKEKLKNIIGFIKYPREIPDTLRTKILNMGDEDYYKWIGLPKSELDEDFFISPEPDDIFTFALFRFRKLPHFFDTPIGIVKLQILKEESEKNFIREIIKAVKFEKTPLPSDVKRLYCEPFPIEEAEKVAKAQLPAEERVRGLVYSFF
jgi:hypothetical protein